MGTQTLGLTEWKGGWVRDLSLFLFLARRPPGGAADASCWWTRRFHAHEADNELVCECALPFLQNPSRRTRFEREASRSVNDSDAHEGAHSYRVRKAKDCWPKMPGDGTALDVAVDGWIHSMASVPPDL